MSKKIITIGRTYGSGGRLLGRGGARKKETVAERA